MAIPTDPGTLVNVAGALSIAAFGVAVGWLARTRTGTAFAVFGAGFGGGILMWYLTPRQMPVFDAGFTIGGLLLAASAVGLFAMALRFPRPRRLDDTSLAGPLLGALVAGIPGLAVSVLQWTGTWPEGPALLVWGFPEGGSLGFHAWGQGFTLWYAAVGFATVLFAQRASRARSASEEREYALIAAAIALFPAFVIGSAMWIGGTPLPVSLYGAGLLLVLLAVGLLWVRNIRTARAPRLARHVAWTILGAVLVGLVVGRTLGWQGGAIQAGGTGLTRLLMVALLGVAVLRHHLFDIDLKVKWTVKQSTVAAAFIAVIFLASEGAQIAFGEENAWLGLVAGGLMVLALAPIQRVAERIADAAMPGVEDTEAYREERKAEVYKANLRMVLMDRNVSREEERVLAHLADELGLSAGAAADLRFEVEEEIADGAPAGEGGGEGVGA